MNIRKFLVRGARSYPDKPFVIFEDRKISFLTLRDASFTLANYLINSGVEKSQKIAVFLPSNPRAVFSYLGVFSMGGVLVPLNFMLTEEEVIHFINHSESSVLITQPKKGVDLLWIKKSCPRLREIIVSTQEETPFVSWDDILRKVMPEEPPVPIEQNDLAAIFYTSGSTGHPKGAMLTYRHLDNCNRAMNYYLELSSLDIFLCAGLPFAHLGGFDYITLTLYSGATFVLMERFHPLETLRNIEKYKPTFMWLVPSMYVAILSLKEYDKFDLSSLRYVNVFGAPSSPALLRKFHTVCPQAHLLNGWGMTETAAPNCYMPPGIEKIESIGKFTAGLEPKIVDSQGNRLGPYQQGELWVKGEVVMVGYYREPGLTKEVITDEGWLKTGDIAYYDEDDLFYIIGRKRDMIKVAGELVFSPEVEEKIHLHPKVQEVAVVGFPDKLRGEVPKAFVVLKEAHHIREQELRDFLKKHLAHFKIPHQFEFVDELPKTKSGKVNKEALKKARV